MKALLHTAPFRLEYTDVPDPEPGPEEVLIRISACGICGSDVHGYTGESGRRIPPIIMGHEAAGIVEEVGREVPRIRPGQRVAVNSTIYCNRCPPCRRGRFNHCQSRQVLGVSVPEFRRHGAFAQYLAVPWWIVVPLADALDFRQAALLEPVSIALHAANRSPLQEAATVLILGAGPIGLFILQAVKLHSPSRVVVCDLDPWRLQVAQGLGADEVTQRVEPDLQVDVCFEAVGIAPTFQAALAATRIGGHVTLVGNLLKTAEVNVQELVSRELTLSGSYAAAGEFQQAAELVASGQIQVQPLISQVAPLSQGANYFDRLRRREGELLKVILEP